jgi:hypothetical protein
LTDTERLDWLEKQQGLNLVSDDDGLWAVSTSGTQPAPHGQDSGPWPPEDFATVSFVDRDQWRPSIREAIDLAIARSAVSE